MVGAWGGFYAAWLSMFRGVMIMIIIAIDPGQTSGFIKARLRVVMSERVHDPELNMVTSMPCEPYLAVRITDQGEWTGLSEFAQCRDAFDGVEVCVMENYIIYPHAAKMHTGSRVPTARIIGHVEHLLWGLGISEVAGSLVFQTASQAKQRWPNERMQSVGHSTHGSTHIKDALRHLLTYVETAYTAPFRLE